MKPGIAQWEEYLGRVAERSPEGRLMGIVWRAAHAAVLARGGLLPVPSASHEESIRPVGGKGHLSWDDDAHHVDIDIMDGGALEWFYRNRKTNELDGTEDPIAAAPLPDALLDRLMLVSTASP